MPDFLDTLIQNALTGRAAAALAPPPALADYSAVSPTPPFVPTPSGVSPIITGGPSGLPTPNLPNIPTPGDPGANAMAIAPQAPLDFNAALERARAAAAGILGPEQTMQPEKGPGALGTILQVLSQGLTAAMSRNPGETLAGFQQVAMNQRNQNAAAAREDRLRREQLTAQIFQGELADTRRQQEEARREARQTEKEMQAYMNRQREILGEQSFQANQAELARIFQDKKEKERERAADEKQQLQFQQQLKIEKGKLRKAFLDQGAGNYADELADYALGQKDELSPGAEKANRTIQAKIERLQGLAARASGGGGGGGRSGGGSGKVETWAILSDGSTVQADKVNIDRLPPGVTVKQLFSTMGGTPIGQGGAQGGGAGQPLTKEMVESAIVRAQGQRVPQIQIANQLRSLPDYKANQRTIEQVIKMYQLEAPAAPQPPPKGPNEPIIGNREVKAAAGAVKRGVKGFLDSFKTQQYDPTQMP